MSIASSARSFALNCALCAVFLTGAALGWGGQSTPAEKDQAGGQAGSGGKAPDQMGARGGTESPMRTSDPSKDKTTKKKKSRKPAPTKSSSSSS
jgi:hypothetical protein